VMANLMTMEDKRNFPKNDLGQVNAFEFCDQINRVLDGIGSGVRVWPNEMVEGCIEVRWKSDLMIERGDVEPSKRFVAMIEMWLKVWMGDVEYSVETNNNGRTIFGVFDDGKMVFYRPKVNKRISFSVKIGVKLDGKVVGEIRGVEGGWQYFPRGQKKGGDVFASLERLKESLY